ncbi:MAG: hypothetical protein Q4C49_03280 [Bacillota bacterium]|nr:hypothetical protein [Bacillota bacterium]
MKENNVFVLETGSTNFVLEALNWIEDGIISLKVGKNDPMCSNLSKGNHISLFGVHAEARINVFLDKEYDENCNNQYLCQIIDCTEIDGVVHYVFEVIKKIVFADFQPMSNTFFEKFFKNRIETKEYEWSVETPPFGSFGPYR